MVNTHRLGIIAADIQRPIATNLSARSFIIPNVQGRMRWLRFPRRRLETTDVNRRRIKSALDMRGVEFLDHFDAGATVFGDLIDIGTLYQPHTDISMASAISCVWLFIAVPLEFCTVQNVIEEFNMIFREDRIGELGLFQQRWLGGVIWQSFSTTALLFPAVLDLHRLGPTN